MEPLEAFSIPDSQIAELYRNETSFQRWCHSTLFPAELAALLESLLNQSERIPYSVSDVLGKIMPIARTITGSPEALSQLSDEEQAFMSSSNANLALNTEVGPQDISATYTNEQATFALRLIAIPKLVVAQIKAGSTPQALTAKEDVEQQQPTNHPWDYRDQVST